MRIVSLIACLMLVFSASLGFAADAKKVKSQASSDCLSKCEKQKEQCFGQYKKSDSTSGTYITPDGHKICWEAYHACKNNCPK